MFDADEIARRVVMPGSEGLRAVAEAFGPDVLTSSGELDRARLGALVFSDEKKRKLLNSILHPLVIAEQDSELAEAEKRDPEGVAVVDAALMIESGGYKRFDKLIVVHCDPAIQKRRLMKRDGLSYEDALKRISAQMPQEEKIRYADYAIDTSHGYKDTRRRTEEVYRKLKDDASKKSVS